MRRSESITLPQVLAVMPFTPFHWGPALLLGLVFLGYLDLPTLLLSSVIVDFEPLLVLTLNLQYPLHGYFHSLLGGTIVALPLALAMSKMKTVLHPLMSFFRLKQDIVQEYSLGIVSRHLSPHPLGLAIILRH